MTINRFAYCLSLWLLVLLMAACERSHPQVEAVLQQADALMETHPDSAFSLLDSLHYRQPMSKKETARYALLLAKATDKTYQSLIPCDSLLNIALRYYEKPTADRATALLYKACLEDEVNHDEEAIKYLNEARIIMQDFTDDNRTQLILLTLLGNLYYEHKYYEDCLPVYKEALNLCYSEDDKYLLYKNIRSYYTMIEQKDSAMYYYHKTLDYALKSNDSLLIANEYYSRSLYHNVFEEADSALYYMQEALKSTPAQSPKGWLYYELGTLLQQKEANDQAAYYIKMALQDTSFNEVFMANDVLSKIEAKRGNYEVANNYLRNYVQHLDSLYVSERSVDVQQLIYDYETQLKIKSEQVKNERRNNRIKICSVLLFSIIVIFAIYNYLEYKRSLQRQHYEMEELKLKLASLQTSINENQDIINQLQKESAENLSDVGQLRYIIKEKEAAIKKYHEQAIEISNHYFKGTPIYATIISRSKASKQKENLKVLTHKEQELLKNEVFAIYSTYIGQLKGIHPALKDEDVLLLCLEQAGVGNQAIALCLGSTDLHIVYARRARMKDRMTHVN